MSKHGLWNHRLYHVWNNMMRRCYVVTNNRYYCYGERGILVCDRWHCINNFIEDMYPTFKEGLTIDRIDTNGNYEPSNCKWSNKIFQARNKRLIQRNNTSGYRGVSFQKSRNKFIAQIAVNGTNKNLGRYITAIEAAKAYDTYVIKNDLGCTLNNV